MAETNVAPGVLTQLKNHEQVDFLFNAIELLGSLLCKQVKLALASSQIVFLPSALLNYYSSMHV